jgi:hypothetical protein
MRWRVIILLIALGGCAHQPADPIPDTFSTPEAWQAHASNQIQAWVPLGTPAMNAQMVMEQHNFLIVTNSPAFLVVSYESSGSWKNPMEEIINVTFQLENGNVSNELVGTGLKGP